MSCPENPRSNGTDPRARRYSNLKYSCVIADTILSLVFLFVLAASGLSLRIAQWSQSLFACRACAVGAYLVAASCLAYLVSVPLHYYSSFVIEHRFHFSRQSFGAWARDQVKAGALSLALGYAALMTFYWIYARSQAWWLPVAGVWILFSLVLAQLAPVVIIPLFFKQTRLSDESLRERIMTLARKMEFGLFDVFEINFSSKTVKANAAMTGWGMTRRVLLGDTLRGRFTHDEIEVILAHEFAHYKFRHILKTIAYNGMLSLVLFYLVAKTSAWLVAAWGYASLADPAALPVLGIYASVFGIVTQPLAAYISRRFERQADRAALAATGNTQAFISAMEKLADQNLADRNPHPLIKFFFFTHPPISERIALAQKI